MAVGRLSKWEFSALAVSLTQTQDRYVQSMMGFAATRGNLFRNQMSRLQGNLLGGIFVKSISDAKKAQNVAIVSAGVLVLNYVGYSVLFLAAAVQNRYLSQQMLFSAMIVSMVVIIAVLLFSWSEYSTAFGGKTLVARSSLKVWRVLKFGFVGFGFVLVAILLAMVSSGLKNIIVIGSIGLAESFIAGVWVQLDYIARTMSTETNINQTS